MIFIISDCDEDRRAIRRSNEYVPPRRNCRIAQTSSDRSPAKLHIIYSTLALNTCRLHKLYLQIREHLQPVEIMAALIGAVAHDLDHPGVNQPFLIATCNHLASLYQVSVLESCVGDGSAGLLIRSLLVSQNNSVLENHHWRSGVGCVIESGIATHLGDLWPTLKDQIGSLILATDITRQNEFVLKFKVNRSSGVVSPRSGAHDRQNFIFRSSSKMLLSI